jgi:hypothetical protein
MSMKKTGGYREELDMTREPSPRDRELCEERIRQLPEWEEWNRDAVVELGGSLGHEPPELLLEDPRIGLVQLDDLTRNEDMERISREQAVWVESRLHAFVALYLMAKFDGHWTVDDDPSSLTFGRYLVSVRNPDAEEPVRIDVGERVHTFLHNPPLRSLVSMVIDIEKSVVTSAGESET